jgi:hypothetical protein
MEAYGRTVPESEAHMYVENYKALRQTLVDEVLPQPVPETASQEYKDSVAFHKSKVNAFLFDVALVRALLDASDAPTHFAVFLGAIGVNPTVVLGGLKESTPNTLRATDSEPPEHPGTLVGVKYPSEDNGPITITG